MERTPDSCDFSEKALNAQIAGATGVIVVDSVNGSATAVLAAGENSSQVTIPVLMLDRDAGLRLVAAIEDASTASPLVSVKFLPGMNAGDQALAVILASVSLAPDAIVGLCQGDLGVSVVADPERTGESIESFVDSLPNVLGPKRMAGRIKNSRL